MTEKLVDIGNLNLPGSYGRSNREPIIRIERDKTKSAEDLAMIPFPNRVEYRDTQTGEVRIGRFKDSEITLG